MLVTIKINRLAGELCGSVAFVVITAAAMFYLILMFCGSRLQWRLTGQPVRSGWVPRQSINQHSPQTAYLVFVESCMQQCNNSSVLPYDEGRVFRYEVNKLEGYVEFTLPDTLPTRVERARLYSSDYVKDDTGGPADTQQNRCNSVT